jgi:glutathione S-transferase
MMGYTLLAARYLGVLGDDFPAVAAYQARISGRPAFQRAAAA